MYIKRKHLRRHRHFYHPKADRLYALMKCTNPNKVPSIALKEFEDSQDDCVVCQREVDMLYCFQVSMSQGVCIFNQFISLVLMKLYIRTVLQVVDDDAKFSATLPSRALDSCGKLECSYTYLGDKIFGVPRNNGH